MPAAWDITTGSPNVTVAVVDTGIDPSEPDLQGALVPGWDFITNGYTKTDGLGHGTLSATFIAARGNNGAGVTGYCWRCKIMPVRVSSNGTTFDGGVVAQGIIWAVDHGAQIISIGFSDEAAYAPDSRVTGAIGYAARHNVLVVASAGNTGNSSFTHPASSTGAYAVGATDQSDQLYSWSTRGSWIHVAAPGCQVGIWPGQGSMRPCGTSTSAPAVAGIAALMLSVNPSLTPAQIMAALQQTAIPVAGIAGGRVDAYRALIAVGGKPPASPPPPPASAGGGSVSAKLNTRVRRGSLRMHWHVRIDVKQGRVAATLRSPKAKSCTVSLKSSDSIWLSKKRRQNMVTLAVKVPAGTYGVDVWCKVRRPARSALAVRAPFA
jgi:subtilisin family serine protease